MLKAGVRDLRQLRLIVQDGDISNCAKNISITLYNQILEETNADELEKLILLLLADERGAYKLTYGKRFEEFDDNVLKILQENFDPKYKMHLHDATVSDGRTAIDFFNNHLQCIMIAYFMPVGSNQESGSIVHGCIYKKSAQAFSMVWQSGSGAPIVELIVTYRHIR